MRGRLGLMLAVAACSSPKPKERPAPDAAPVAKPKAPPDADPSLPAHHDAPDLGTAIHEIVGADVRVLGVGEIHQQNGFPTNIRSALSRFTDDVLPAVEGRASDLVVETWAPDKNCGGKAEATTKQVETDVARPAATKSELAVLGDKARAAKIRPHAMKLTCDDWNTVAPKGKEVDYEQMLSIITRELGRIASEATAHSPTRLVITYGGALHNDLYPNPDLAQWSFAAKADEASGGHYEELDLIVPEYAEQDKLSQAQPWYPLLSQAGPDHVVVIERAPRSYVILLPRTS